MEPEPEAGDLGEERAGRIGHMGDVGAVDGVGPEQLGCLEQLCRRGHRRRVRIVPAHQHPGGHLVEGTGIRAVVLPDVDADGLRDGHRGEDRAHGHELVHERTGPGDEPGGGQADDAAEHERRAQHRGRGPRRPPSPEVDPAGEHGQPHQAPGGPLDRRTGPGRVRFGQGRGRIRRYGEPIRCPTHPRRTFRTPALWPSCSPSRGIRGNPALDVYRREQRDCGRARAASSTRERPTFLAAGPRRAGAGYGNTANEDTV